MSVITNIITDEVSNINTLDSSFCIIDLFDISNNNLVYKEIKKNRFKNLFFKKLESGNINLHIDNSGSELLLSSENWYYDIDSSFLLYKFVEGVIERDLQINITNNSVTTSSRINLIKKINKIYNIHKISCDLYNTGLDTNILARVLNNQDKKSIRTANEPVIIGDKISYSIKLCNLNKKISDIEFRLHFKII